MHTLSIVTTQYGDTLAQYCNHTKTWYQYSNGRYLRGDVSIFKPLSKAHWYSAPGKVMRNTTYAVQLENGRYTFATYYDGNWYSLTDKELRHTVTRFVRVATVPEGKFKS